VLFWQLVRHILVTASSGVARGGAAAPPNRFSYKKISHQYYDQIPEKDL